MFPHESLSEKRKCFVRHLNVLTFEMFCSKGYKTRDYCENLIYSCAIMKVRRFRGRKTRRRAFYLLRMESTAKLVFQ